MNAHESSSFEYATSIKLSQIKIDFLLGGYTFSCVKDFGIPSINFISNNDESSSYKGCQQLYKNTILSLYYFYIDHLICITHQIFHKDSLPTARRSGDHCREWELKMKVKTIFNIHIVRSGHIVNIRMVMSCSQARAPVCHKPL